MFNLPSTRFSNWFRIPESITIKRNFIFKRYFIRSILFFIPFFAVHVQYVETKSPGFIMAFSHVKAAKDFSNELFKTKKITNACVEQPAQYLLRRGKNALHVGSISVSIQEWNLRVRFMFRLFTHYLRTLELAKMCNWQINLLFALRLIKKIYFIYWNRGQQSAEKIPKRLILIYWAR